MIGYVTIGTNYFDAAKHGPPSPEKYKDYYYRCSASSMKVFLTKLGPLLKPYFAKAVNPDDYLIFDSY